MPELDLQLQHWLETQSRFEECLVSRVVPFTGGASNITCRVDLEGWTQSSLVLRLQRQEGIFAPYDVIREARVHRALRDAPFPVPAVIAEEPDQGPLGAPFILLELIDGLHMGEAGAEADFSQFVGAVAAIHEFDWRAAGLQFLGEPRSSGEAISREIGAVVARMALFGCENDDRLLAGVERLRSRIPDDGRVVFCQGDINAFNYLFRDHRLVGVVDWEQAHLGDSRSDLGQLLALTHLKGAPLLPPSDLPFVNAYEAVSGRAQQGLEFFRAFWFFQLSVIHAGWVKFNGTSPWFDRGHATALLEQALAEVD
ncbi:MAG TPA: phosphotransferase family protein [Dehalococcoidia bacterium]|nr:phosphotransferase family protein [Dehalococcoidia bacterium]